MLWDAVWYDETAVCFGTLCGMRLLCALGRCVV